MQSAGRSELLRHALCHRLLLCGQGIRPPPATQLPAADGAGAQPCVMSRKVSPAHCSIRPCLGCCAQTASTVTGFSPGTPDAAPRLICVEGVWPAQGFCPQPKADAPPLGRFPLMRARLGIMLLSVGVLVGAVLVRRCHCAKHLPVTSARLHASHNGRPRRNQRRTLLVCNALPLLPLMRRAGPCTPTGVHHTD
jgi:hypothetical protein